MNIILDMFKNQSSELAEKLLAAGFDSEQVTEFLPQAAESISQAIGNTDMKSIFESFISGNSTEFLNHIDADNISEKINMPKDQVLTGINAIWPSVSQFIESDETGAQLTASTMFSGLTGAAKKLFN